MTDLSEAQRRPLLDRAVIAVRARLTIGPDTGLTEAERMIAAARSAVTDAVTRGGYLHTQIAQLAGCTGLAVIGLIGDWSAQAHAIAVERNAAKNYADLVRDAARRHALQRLGAQGYGAKSQIAREIGVTRPVVDAWIAQVAAQIEPARGDA